MKADLAVACLLSTVLALTACTMTRTRFQLEVDSLRNSASEERSYLLLPGKEDVMDDDLQFKQYSGYVHRALSMKGFVPADSFEQANVAIFLSYGIGEPQEHQLFYSLRRWDRTVVFSPYSSRRLRSYGRSGSNSDAETDRSTSGVGGGVSDFVRYRTHLRYMILDAFDLKEHRKTEEEVQLWRTTARSTGTSDDLRRVFPVLVAAAVPYIATNTDKRVEIELDEADEQVLKIRSAEEDVEEESASP